MKLNCLLVLVFPALIFAQSIQLRGKVIDDGRKPVANVLIRFTSLGDALTTSSGEFIISIPENVKYVDITLKDDSLQLLYPVDSKIPVPSDPSFITTVLVSKNKNKEAEPDKSKRRSESIKRYAELERLLKENGSTNKEIQEFLKRYIEIESEKLELDKAKLEADLKKSGIRDELFENISPLLSEYLLRLKNLKTSFETYTEIAFVSNPGIENLNKAVRTYNPLFDTISNNYKSWKKEISSGWDQNLSEKFGLAVNYMIDEVHKPYVLQLNECIRMINEVKLKIGNEDEQQEKKEKIRQNLSFIMKNLELKIPILESRFNELLTAMELTGNGTLE
ncbi:MAG TPA: hypothetical protein VMT35_04090 [Ignavibacteriaceae bacterium]|nr:hypothetical protein [Ignavibacteriaceae bacterium]